MPRDKEQAKAYQVKYRAENAEKIKAYRAANADKIKARMAKYRAANAEKYKAHGRKWRAENREYDKARQVKYNAENREKVRIRQAKWLVANPEKAKARSDRYERTEKAKSVRAKFSAKYGPKWRAQLEQRVRAIVGHECAWQDLGGCSGGLEMDHTIPVGQRRNTGYTSDGTALRLWIVKFPALAKQKLQPLCWRHNGFKKTHDNTTARELWKAKHPQTLKLNFTVSVTVAPQEQEAA